jgi:hypothetical protein
MDTKYTFIETQGCLAFDFTVNGESLADITPESEKEILEYLLEKLKVRYSEKSIGIGDIVSLFESQDYHYEKTACEQCGDHVSSTTWKI